MSVYTTKDLTKEFNSVVKRFMNDGYILSPFTVSGMYGNTVSYVDMINEDDKDNILRIWLIDEHETIDNKYYTTISVAGVRVNKYKVDEDFTKKQSLWPNNGETVYEKLFYMFKEQRTHSNNFIKIYTDSVEEAVKYINIGIERYSDKSLNNKRARVISVDKLPSKFVDRVMKKINAVRGFKRANALCITSVVFGKNDYNELTAKVDYSFNNKQGYLVFK